VLLRGNGMALDFSSAVARIRRVGHGTAVQRVKQADLMKHEPDFLFEDFSATVETLTALGFTNGTRSNGS
jgi:hypothetical protein